MMLAAVDARARRERLDNVTVRASLGDSNLAPSSVDLPDGPRTAAFLPEFGQDAWVMTPDTPNCGAMPDPSDVGDLIDYLVRSSRLTQPEAVRLVNDVLEFLSETPEDYIRRRHLQLQAHGLSNEAIFTQIASELSRRRFRAPAFTQRQIRRVIYG